MQHRAQVDVHEQVDALRIGVEQRAGTIHTGVVDEDVERVLARECGDAVQVGHVDGVRNAAGTLGQLGQRLRASCQGMDLHALTAQAFDNGGTDSGRRSSDQSGFVVCE